MKKAEISKLFGVIKKISYLVNKNMTDYKKTNIYPILY